MTEAETLFAEKGFNGTSVREIADKAGINIAMISYYFGSKEKLLEAIFDYRGNLSKLAIENIIAKQGISSLDKINLLIDNYIEKIFSQQNFYKILSREQVVNNTGPLADLILIMKRNNQKAIARLFEEGQKKKEFNKNVNVNIMMTTIVGTANHLLTTKHFYRQLNKQENLSDEAFNKVIKKQLSQHLKFITKAILTNEL